MNLENLNLVQLNNEDLTQIDLGSHIKDMVGGFCDGFGILCGFVGLAFLL